MLIKQLEKEFVILSTKLEAILLQEKSMLENYEHKKLDVLNKEKEPLLENHESLTERFIAEIEKHPSDDLIKIANTTINRIFTLIRDNHTIIAKTEKQFRTMINLKVESATRPPMFYTDKAQLKQNNRASIGFEEEA